MEELDPQARLEEDGEKAPGDVEVPGRESLADAPPDEEPEEPPGPEVPAGVTITSEQEEQREALMQSLAGAPIGSIPSDLFPKYLLLRAEGYNVDEIADRSNMPVDVLRQGEEEFVSWLTGGLGREARVLFQADPNLWRFLRYYYHA